MAAFPSALLAMAISALGAHGQPPVDLPKLVKHVSPSIGAWKWVALDGTILSQATAFVVGDGLLLTNHHVAAQNMRDDAFAVVQFSDDMAIGVSEATIVYSNRESDLVLVQLEAPYPRHEFFGGQLAPIIIKHAEALPAAISIADRPVQVGEAIITIGNPMGLSSTVSQGIVSALPSGERDAPVIQLSVPASSGSSGSPVLDSSGRLIGMVHSHMKDGEQLVFATPLSSEALKQRDWGPAYSVAEWSMQEHTQTEVDQSNAMFERSTTVILEHLQTLVDEARASPDRHTRAGRLNDRISLDYLITLQYALRSGVPDHLTPEANRISTHWQRAIRLLDPDDARRELQTQVDLAYKAARMAYLSRPAMKWAAAFCNDVELLRRAHLEMPQDEAITWEYAQVLLRQPKAVARAAQEGLGDLEIKVHQEAVGNAAGADGLLGVLLEQNPLWALDADYWHEVGCAKLMLGEVDEAVSAFLVRVQECDGLIVALIGDEKEDARYAYSMWYYGLSRGVVSAESLVKTIEAYANSAAQLNANDILYKVKCQILRIEAEQILDVLKHSSDPMTQLHTTIASVKIDRLRSLCP